MDKMDDIPEDTTEVLVYGFDVASFEIMEDLIKPNQPLSEILVNHNISFSTINQLANQAKDIFDVRKIRAGNKYSLIFDKKTKDKLAYFVYEQNPIEYIVFALNDSLSVYKGQKEVETVVRESAGNIETSLYMSMIENGDSPVLIDKLTDIFAWQIDFFTIQKNDKFKVIYEEQLVDGKSVGIGKVKGAWFEHMGESNYAIYFEKDSTSGYYDLEGNSMRKAFLKAPLKYSRISSRYTPRRFHPVLKTMKAHLGTDYAAAPGTPIYSVGDGTIIEAQYSKYNGNYVKVKHNGTYTTQYLHMSRIASGIRSGKRVQQGEVIGYVGSTGLATGPHLCFRFWKNGVQVDPFSLKMPPSKALEEHYLGDYQKLQKEVKAQLDNIAIPDLPNHLAMAE